MRPRARVHLDRTSIEPTTRSEGGRLSVAPAGKEGASIFDEWSRIVAEAKHDLNREVLLRLNFFAEAGFRDFDLDGFRAGKRLGTTDIELEARPSAIQFARDD
jgi:hypothetical protein